MATYTRRATFCLNHLRRIVFCPESQKSQARAGGTIVGSAAQAQDPIPKPKKRRIVLCSCPYSISHSFGATIACGGLVDFDSPPTIPDFRSPLIPMPIQPTGVNGAPAVFGAISGTLAKKSTYNAEIWTTSGTPSIFAYSTIAGVFSSIDGTDPETCESLPVSHQMFFHVAVGPGNPSAGALSFNPSYTVPNPMIGPTAVSFGDCFVGHDATVNDPAELVGAAYQIQPSFCSGYQGSPVGGFSPFVGRGAYVGRLQIPPGKSLRVSISGYYSAARTGVHIKLAPTSSELTGPMTNLSGSGFTMKPTAVGAPTGCATRNGTNTSAVMTAGALPGDVLLWFIEDVRARQHGGAMTQITEVAVF